MVLIFDAIRHKKNNKIKINHKYIESPSISQRSATLYPEHGFSLFLSHTRQYIDLFLMDQSLPGNNNNFFSLFISLHFLSAIDRDLFKVSFLLGVLRLGGHRPQIECSPRDPGSVPERRLGAGLYFLGSSEGPMPD